MQGKIYTLRTECGSGKSQRLVAIMIVVVIIPVVVAVPTVTVGVPPAVVVIPTISAGFCKLMPVMFGLRAVGSMFRNSFVKVVIGFDGALLAIILGARSGRPNEEKCSGED